jgi:hypothetical protein
LVRYCVGNFFLKHIIERNIGGGMEVMGRQGRKVSNYWINLKKGEDIGN